jgi:DNA-binding HxlR family transcriptional regulator
VRHSSLHTVQCPIGRSVAILGERWTFVILRESFKGARRFEDYLEGTGIARNILAERLKALVEHGILDRRPYAEHASRTLHEYRLTDKGLDLYPILVTLVEWGTKYGDFEETPLTLTHKSCGHVTRPQFVCSECGEPIHAREMLATGPSAQRVVA